VTDTLILILPADPEGPVAWARAEAGAIVGTGQDFDGEESDCEVIALTPAAQTALDWITLPDLPQAQRDGAAREMLADQLIDPASLHLATGDAEDDDGLRPVAWADDAHVEGWIARLTSLGVSPSALVPAQLAILPPNAGLLSAQIGDETIIRAPWAGWLSDPTLDAALGGDAAPVAQSERQRDAGLLRLIDAPGLNLISGRFAPKRSWSLGAGTGRRLALLAAALVGVSLLLPVVQNWQTNRAAETLEAETAQAASALFPGASDPAVQLSNQITARRGGGAGFLPTLSAVTSAVSSTADVELTGMRFLIDGTLETTIRATNAAEAATVRAKIEAQGFTVEVGTESQNQGRLLLPIKVRGS
jgi:general secretion pathway protein L